MTDEPIETKTNNSEVGYKNPPVKSRFRKGQSGNPRGRRKGQRNLTSVLREVLAQTVTVKRSGKSQRMSKADALVLTVLSQAHSGDRRAIKAQLDLIEKVGRIHTPGPKLMGAINSGCMLVPGVAASREEWERESTLADELAQIREIVKAGEAAGRLLDAAQRAALRQVVATARAAGRTVTPSQLDALRESLGFACLAEAPAVTRREPLRRPVNRIDKRPPVPTLENSSISATAAPQSGAIEPTPESVPTTTQRPMYRKVNRQQPGPPATDV